MHLNTQHENELSFVELMKLFWHRRILILIVAFTCFFLSLGYLLYTKPLYEANAFITLPMSLDLSELNAAAFHDPSESLLKKYSVTDIYSIYIQNLLSEPAKRRFFEKVYLVFLGAEVDIESKELAYRKFLKVLKIKADPIDKNNYKVSFVSYSPQEAKNLLSRYLQLAFEGFLIDLKTDVDYQLKAKLLNLKLDLASTKELSQKYRADSLKQLQRALNEAKEEKIAHFHSSSLDNRYFQPFMLGAKILTTRINELQKQKIATALIPKYLKLKTDYSFYSSIRNSFVLKIQFPLFNSEVNVPEVPISPKSNLILLLGLLVGCMLGLIITLIVTAISQNDKSTKSQVDCRTLNAIS